MLYRDHQFTSIYSVFVPPAMCMWQVITSPFQAWGMPRNSHTWLQLFRPYLHHMAQPIPQPVALYFRIWIGNWLADSCTLQTLYVLVWSFGLKNQHGIRAKHQLSQLYHTLNSTYAKHVATNAKNMMTCERHAGTHCTLVMQSICLP